MTDINTGQQVLNIIKETANRAGPAVVIRVSNPATAYLRPVATRPDCLNHEDVELLTRWRNNHPRAFLTEFTATTDRTEKWLSNTVHHDSGRILFMVEDSTGDTIGYMGLAYIDWDRRYGEADAVVRGKPAPGGLMKQSLLTLLDWARHGLGLEEIGVRVLSDNPAIEFYKKCGFVETKRIALSSRRQDGEVSWYENSDNATPERSLVYHTLDNRD
ncbi:MAG: GNAT family N-acetyltransferase [Pseudomonadota bacterium]